MVGVPRSKGCRTCIQRRVKCDETRPSCTNCARIKQVCPGYVQTVKFQDEGPRLRQKHEKARDSDSREDDRTSPRSSSRTPPSEPRFEWDSGGSDFNTGPTSIVFGLVEGKTELYKCLVPTEPSSRRRLSRENIPSDVLGYKTASTLGSLDAPFYCPALYQFQVLYTFAKSKGLVPLEDADTGFEINKTRSAHVTETDSSDYLFDTAARAVTMVQFGRLERQSSFVDESRSLYGKALRLLHSAVLSKEESSSSRTLCATVLLSYYEMFSSADDATWIRHATGVGALMRQRGPQCHRSGFDREIFLSYRHTLLVEAFYRGEVSFLDEPQWRELSSQIFVDIQEAELLPSEMSGVYEAVEAIYSHVALVTRVCADAQREEMSSTTYQISILNQLQDARAEMIRLHSRLVGAFQRLGHLPTEVTTPDPSFRINYVYENIYVACCYSAYRAVSIVMNAHIVRIGGMLAAKGLFDQSDVYSLRAENRSLAVDICKSVNDMLKSSFMGPFHAVFALRIASQVFETHETQWDWIIAKLWEIGDRHMLMARHLPWYEDQVGVAQSLEHAKDQMKQRQQLGRIC